MRVCVVFLRWTPLGLRSTAGWAFTPSRCGCRDGFLRLEKNLGALSAIGCRSNRFYPVRPIEPHTAKIHNLHRARITALYALASDAHKKYPSAEAVPFFDWRPHLPPVISLHLEGHSRGFDGASFDHFHCVTLRNCVVLCLFSSSFFGCDIMRRLGGQACFVAFFQHMCFCFMGLLHGICDL